MVQSLTLWYIHTIKGKEYTEHLKWHMFTANLLIARQCLRIYNHCTMTFNKHSFHISKSNMSLSIFVSLSAVIQMCTYLFSRFLVPMLLPPSTLCAIWGIVWTLWRPMPCHVTESRLTWALWWAINIRVHDHVIHVNLYALTVPNWGVPFQHLNQTSVGKVIPKGISRKCFRKIDIRAMNAKN